VPRRCHPPTPRSQKSWTSLQEEQGGEAVLSQQIDENLATCTCISKTNSGTPICETHAAIIYGVNDADQNIPEVLH